MHEAHMRVLLREHGERQSDHRGDVAAIGNIGATMAAEVVAVRMRRGSGGWDGGFEASGLDCEDAVEALAGFRGG